MLSRAKHLSEAESTEEILRCAQDDKKRAHGHTQDYRPANLRRTPLPGPNASRWLAACACTLAAAAACLQAGWPARAPLAITPWILLGTYGAICLVAPYRPPALPRLQMASQPQTLAFHIG